MAYEYEAEATQSDINYAENGGVALSGAYNPIRPNVYVAKLNFIEERDWTSKNIHYIGLRPDITIQNEEGTHIGMQDFTLWTVDETGKPYRTDGKTDKSAIWGGIGGAEWMLKALGFIVTNVETNKTKLTSFEPKAVFDRMVKVKTAIGGYIKGLKGRDGNWDHERFGKEMRVIAGGSWAVEDLEELIAEWNNQNGNDNNSDERLRAKNMIVGWSALTPEEVEQGGYYLATDLNRMVFTTKIGYETFKANMNGQKASADNKPKKNGTNKF